MALLSKSSGFHAKGTASFGDVTVGALTSGAIVSSGAISAEGGIAGVSPMLVPPMFDTGPMTATAGRCYAQWVGRADRRITSLKTWIYSAAAPVGAGATEIGVATGVLNYSDNSESLTTRGFVDISSLVITGTTTKKPATITGLNIAPGDDIWLVNWASYATTQPSWRYHLGVDATGLSRFLDGYRPSLNIGVAGAFACTPGSALVSCPQMHAELLP